MAASDERLSEIFFLASVCSVSCYGDAFLARQLEESRKSSLIRIPEIVYQVATSIPSFGSFVAEPNSDLYLTGCSW